MFTKTPLRMSVSLLIVLLLVLFTMKFVNSTGRQIVRIKDGKTASFDEMVSDVSGARAVFIGEQHDDPAHHKTQLDVITALHEKEKPLAIGLEMFKNENQDDLDAWVRGGNTRKGVHSALSSELAG